MKNLNTFKLLSDYESEKSGGVLNTPNVSFVAEDNSVRYLLEDPYNGHSYVDLGLPSGLKWATCNVGARNPEDYGLYFAWGETTGYTAEQVTGGERVFDRDTYDVGSAASISVDLTLEQDAAHVNMGGSWRIPTKAEFEELINSSYTTKAWTTDFSGTGVAGSLFTSKINGNSVFFPAAGHCVSDQISALAADEEYWSASWYSLSHAWGLESNSWLLWVYNSPPRHIGLSVRGVCE